jgi:hypothetical protein
LNPLSLMFDRDRYGVRAGHWLGILVLLGLLLPLVRRDRQSLWLFGLALAFWLLLGSRTPRLRYVFPAIPLFAVAAGGVLARRLSDRGSLALLGLIVVGMFATQGRLQWQKLRVYESYAYLSGRTTRLEWLEVGGYNVWPTVVPMIEQVNARVAAGALDAEETLFLIGEGRCNLFLTRCLPDSSWSAYRWRAELAAARGDLSAVAASFAARGIHHLVFNRDYLRSLCEAGQVPATRLRPALFYLSRFVARYGRVLFDDGSIVLVELHR